MRKVILSSLITLLFVGLMFSGTERFGALASSNVTGILYQDTTWTKVESPYTLTGPIAVNTGVTLTIQPGTVVDLNSFYIQVNGTLIARGTETEPINFNSGLITFTVVSNGWNEQTGSGSIIENALFSTASLETATSLKVNHNIIKGNVIASASSLLIGNNITGSVSVKDSTIVSDNTLKSGISGSGPVTISNNAITGAASLFSAVIVVYVANDNPSSPLIFSGNTIDGGPQAPGKGPNVGLEGSGYISINNNFFYACAPAIRGAITGLVQKNYFDNSSGGIR